MATTYTLHFSQPPRAWTLYPKILAGRKASHLPDGKEVPRIEARLESYRIDRGHLKAYRSVCGCAEGDELPICYPHVLASPLHMAILGSDAFPVRLMGLVHVANRIVQRRPLREGERGTIACHIEGHRESERGQEFEMHTRCLVEGEELWLETSSFLARRRPAKGAAARRKAPGAPSEGGTETPHAVRTASFPAPAGLGRRYAWVSGDFNPIHMADATARLFGFNRAIAHGMWSLARCASELPAALQSGPCELEVSFKLPVLLPAWVMMQSWETPRGVDFALRDSQGEKPHLTGALRALE